MTWRTTILVCAAVLFFAVLLVWSLWPRGFDTDAAPLNPKLVAASAGRAFVVDMEAMPTTTTTVPPTTTTTARARTAPTVRVSRPAPAVAGGSVWDRLAACESHGNWSINTGNGYFGGLQMDMQFWRSYGGPVFAGRPDLASREQQIVVAERARDSGRGYHPWPTCARRLGLV